MKEITAQNRFISSFRGQVQKQIAHDDHELALASGHTLKIAVKLSKAQHCCFSFYFECIPQNEAIDLYQ